MSVNRNSTVRERMKAIKYCKNKSIVNDIRNIVFSLAKAGVYVFCKSWKQKFIMSFAINKMEMEQGIWW